MPNFMTSLPRAGLLFCGSLFARRPESSLGQFRKAEGGLHRAREWLVLWAIESLLVARPSPIEPHDHLYAASGFRAEGRCRLAESEARQERHAAGLPAVRLCRH